MADEKQDGPTGKFIKLADRVWDALGADAERCRRSVTKQIEAILLVYYGLDGVDLGDVPAVREAVSPYLARDTSRVARAERIRRLIEEADPRHDKAIDDLEYRLHNDAQTLPPKDVPARKVS